MDCGTDSDGCRDSVAALHLKIAAIVVILVACVVGVCMPLVGKRYPVLHPDSHPFFVLKSFAAGVILATAFVHMLPDAFESLTKSCLPEKPWGSFPFAGLISMMAALGTLLIDFSATAYYQSKNATAQHHHHLHQHQPASVLQTLQSSSSTKSGECEIVNSGHVHPANTSPIKPHTHSVDIGGHPHSDAVSEFPSDTQLRQRVISQVLELGIVAHSVIIGISLGTSESPCTIRPLLAALTFHQFFEGIALGGCIAQAAFKRASSGIMAFFFSITTPLGIAIGIGIASSYNENSPTALIVEGVFDSMSAGILVYMSLVDLIATDFMSKRLQSDLKLQIHAYIALFLGAGLMSLIAYWA